MSPLEAQPKPPNIVALTAALVQRWPMTNLLDILQEAELRVGFTEAFHPRARRPGESGSGLGRSGTGLLLCVYGSGRQRGPQAHVLSGEARIATLTCSTSARRYITKEHLRAAITQVCNAIFRVRDPALWSESTTACASDSKKFGAWDQNLMTEWHIRYGGRGVMVYLSEASDK